MHIYQLTMAVAAKPVRNILETSAILASTPPNTLDLYAGTTYGPLIQYPHRSNQNAAKNLACIDLTFAGFSSSSAVASADLLSLEIPSPPVFAAKRSNVLKPTAAIASTIRSESNRTTGSQVAEDAMLDIDFVTAAERDVRSPPARGMARTTDLAAAAALPAAGDIDARTLVVEILLPLLHFLVIAAHSDDAVNGLLTTGRDRDCGRSSSGGSGKDPGGGEPWRKARALPPIGRANNADACP